MWSFNRRHGASCRIKIVECGVLFSYFTKVDVWWSKHMHSMSDCVQNLFSTLKRWKYGWVYILNDNLCKKPSLNSRVGVNLLKTRNVSSIAHYSLFLRTLSCIEPVHKTRLRSSPSCFFFFWLPYLFVLDKSMREMCWEHHYGKQNVFLKSWRYTCQ